MGETLDLYFTACDRLGGREDGRMRGWEDGSGCGEVGRYVVQGWGGGGWEGRWSDHRVMVVVVFITHNIILYHIISSPGKTVGEGDWFN